ncbi:MAG: efflux RND transporter periplasmic adaptor subunit, partial [Gammaproteobacteria bacterium]|nr:efflux RND transporter periplasmic adaptor subunit [Gammaproteobacteria bacterium]
MDKAELVNRLKIDREETASSGRPLKWFIAIAVVAGAAIASYSLGLLDAIAPTAEAGPLPVETVLAQAESSSSPGDSVLDATGYVVARRQATVSSKVTAKVIDVLVEEGMVVERGQLLAVLDDSIPKARLKLAESQLDAAKAALAELQVNIRQARLDLSRTENLAERNLASQADLDRDTLSVDGLMARLSRTARDIAVSERSLALQRQELTDMEIRAPFGGVVIAKAAQPGEMISPVSAGGGFTRTGICTIVDMDSLEVEVDVNEAYINRVYPDQPVTVALNAYPDDDFPASVIATIPAADRNKATVRVRIRFLERDARVLPDMGVRVSFLERSQEERSQAPGQAAAQA